MLRYEEKFHFDQRYKKIQEASSNQLGWLLGSIVCYLLLFYVLLWLRGRVPDASAWNSVSTGYSIAGIHLHAADLVYFFIGLSIMYYGTVRLAEITRENHKAVDKAKNRPTHLVTNGYYADVRHPMYGTFIFMYSSLAFSIHSALGLLFAALIIIGQYINAYFEETHTLLPLFKDEYKQYQKKTQALILTKWQIIVLSLLFIITLAGFIKLI